MGLFDQVFGAKSTEQQQSLSPAEAFASIALVAIAADGYLSDEEAQGVSFMLSRTQMFKSYPNDVIRRMFDKLLSMLKRQGASALVHSAQASLPFELRETAFAIATDLVLADGVVTKEEQDFLNELYQVLEVPNDSAMKIVEVMMIKNRG